MKVWMWCVWLGVVACVCPVYAGIVAVVNDHPISDFDVSARAKMTLIQEGKEIGTLSKAMKKQALEVLIEEQIKRQVATQGGIVVSSNDIQKAIAHLEAQNGFEPGEFSKVLVQNNIPVSAFHHQIQADLGWLQVIRRAAPVVDVRDIDIKARQQEFRQKLAKESFTFAEIVVKDEPTALDVWQQLQNGADFRHLVETVSISQSKKKGGQVSDATRNYYGKEMAPILEQMQPGQLSRPLKVKNGYALVLMLNKRPAIHSDTVTVWDLMQVIVPRHHDIAEQLKRPILGGCETLTKMVQDVALPESIQRGKIAPDQLPEDIKPLLKEAAFKVVVGPVSMPVGDLYLMKCDQSKERVVPDDETVRAQIEIEEMERLSQRMLAEARRDVVVEYK